MKKTIDEILGSAQKLRTPYGSIQVIPKLTPALATTLLELLAPNQRPVKKSTVEEYARAMKEGRWKWNGDSIRLDDTRHVIDGQHRLLAIVESGVTLDHVPLIITEKANKNAICSIDQGRGRSLTDLRAALGLPQAEATGVSAMMAEKADWIDLRGRYSKNERNDTYEGMPALLADLGKLKKMCVIKRNVWCAGPVSGAIRCMKKNKRIAFNFFAAVFDGTAMIDGQKCEPARQYYTYLLNKPRGRGGMRFVREDAYKAIRAYNAYRNNQELSFLRYEAGTPMPEVV